MIRLAIVEDEDLYANQLTEYINKYSGESKNEFSITRFRDGDEITSGYKSSFDIILMDIQMKFMDGMSAAEEIRKLDSEVIIMFITNMTQYAIRGYAVDALDYVLKPITYFAFSQRLDRAIDRMENRKRHYISFPIPDGIKKLEITDLTYIESQGHTLIYHTARESFASSGKMKDVEDTLSPYGFFRSNKGYLVNMQRVDGVKDGCCVIGSDNLLISRAKKKAFMEALTNNMSEVMK